MTRTLTVLCAGDGFISPELLRDEIASRIEGVEFRLHTSDWPQNPHHHTRGIREWSGDPDEIAALAQGVDAIVTHCAPIDSELLANTPTLKFVGCSRGGAVNVDMEAAKQHGVHVVDAPGRNAIATAEFAVALMLATLRRVVGGSDLLKNGGWGGRFYEFENAGTSLSGLTVGLVGFGQVGQRVAKLVMAFGARVIFFDPWVDATKLDAELAGAESVELDALLESSDVVSIHARLTPDTRNLIDAAALARMKSSAFLINTARGGLLDYDALVEALNSGSIAGAGLDVYATEPLAADAPLRDCPNVVLTPHIAGATKTTAVHSAAIMADALASFIASDAWTNEATAQ